MFGAAKVGIFRGSDKTLLLDAYMGNGIHNRDDGTILLGTRICPGCLKHPREPYENLSDRLRKVSGRGNEITLTIV